VILNGLEMIGAGSCTSPLSVSRRLSCLSKAKQDWWQERRIWPCLCSFAAETTLQNRQAIWAYQGEITVPTLLGKRVEVLRPADFPWNDGPFH